VPCGSSSSSAASRVVRPSITVACSTCRSSGDSARSAVPTSPCSTAISSSSSALRTVGEISDISCDPIGVGCRRLRSREMSWRIAMPHSQAPTSPSPRKPPADRHTATKVSCSASAARSSSVVRRRNRSSSQAECRSKSMRSAGSSVLATRRSSSASLGGRCSMPHTVAAKQPNGSASAKKLRGAFDPASLPYARDSGRHVGPAARVREGGGHQGRTAGESDVWHGVGKSVTGLTRRTRKT